jgi:FdhD protein
MAESSLAVDVSKVSDGRQQQLADSVAVEEPLEIRIGFSTPEGRAVRSISITMRTPGDDADLAAGFLCTESIVASARDIAAIESCGPPAPDSGNRNVVRVELAAGVPVDLGRLQRHFYTTSSCGVCGKASLDSLRALGVAPSTTAVTFSRDVLTAVPRRLRAAQKTFEETGGLHAAAAFDADGELVVVMEDVGRHNAVDKLLGRSFLDGKTPLADHLMVVSGRASFEILQKALVAGVPVIVAVGAPSSLAVEMAEKFGMTLIGFASRERFNIYAGRQRIIES